MRWHLSNVLRLSLEFSPKPTYPPFCRSIKLEIDELGLVVISYHIVVDALANWSRFFGKGGPAQNLNDTIKVTPCCAYS